MTHPPASARFAQLKDIIFLHQETVNLWLEAVREVRDSKLYLEEADTWDEWCQENIGKSANTIRNIIWRDNKKKAVKLIAETTGEPIEKSPSQEADDPNEPNNSELDNKIAKADKFATAMEKRLGISTPAVVIEAQPVDEELPADSRPLIFKLSKEMRRLLPLQTAESCKRFGICLQIVLKLEKMIGDQLPGMAGQKKQRSVGTKEEVIAYCKELGLPESDGKWLWDHWDGNGWTNNGEPIHKWRSVASAWKSARVFPSLKPAPFGGKPAPVQEKTVAVKEMERLAKVIKRL